MLEKVESWINRKFAPDDRPCKRTVVNWIKSGKIYGEQIGGPHGTWYVVHEFARHHLTGDNTLKTLRKMVGTAGFEPTTPTPPVWDSNLRKRLKRIRKPAFLACEISAFFGNLRPYISMAYKPIGTRPPALSFLAGISLQGVFSCSLN